MLQRNNLATSMEIRRSACGRSKLAATSPGDEESPPNHIAATWHNPPPLVEFSSTMDGRACCQGGSSFGRESPERTTYEADEGRGY